MLTKISRRWLIWGTVPHLRRRYTWARTFANNSGHEEMRRTEVTPLALQALAILSISALYYATENQWVGLHNILQHLYFAPIAAAAIYYGWKGGTGAAVLTTLCYAPHLRSEERRVGKECRSRRPPRYQT